MDYNSEIPFEKRPAAGFYDTTVEVKKFHLFLGVLMDALSEKKE